MSEELVREAKAAAAALEAELAKWSAMLEESLRAIRTSKPIVEAAAKLAHLRLESGHGWPPVEQELIEAVQAAWREEQRREIEASLGAAGIKP